MPHFQVCQEPHTQRFAACVNGQLQAVAVCLFVQNYDDCNANDKGREAGLIQNFQVGCELEQLPMLLSGLARCETAFLLCSFHIFSGLGRHSLVVSVSGELDPRLFI